MSTLEIFNFLFQRLGITLEFVEAKIARQVDVHHRKQLGKIQGKNIGIRRQVIRKIRVGLRAVHRVFDFSQGLIRSHIEFKLYVHSAVALNGS